MVAKTRTRKREVASAQTRRKSSKNSRSRLPRSRRPRGEKTGCPIVGIGGSAGGFEAAMELLGYLPPKNGMAFVIVQHLDPHHASRLAELLGKATQMPVMEVTRRVEAKPNMVYVQPPNKCVICKGRFLTLVRRTERLNLAVDHFFESLAEAQGPRAIGVVLSGSGSDGTAGVRAIKGAGGITFAQDERSAKFGSMPRNAVMSGFIDAALPLTEIAAQLGRIADHPYIQDAKTNGAAETEKTDSGNLSGIFLSLKKHTGVDFSAYKRSTLQRRIERRMALHRIEQMRHYAIFLRNNPKEINGLFNDLLINVTRFFRDEYAFKALQKNFIPAIMERKKDGGEFRVWIPGCATGEEVYSVAICLLESIGDAAAKMRVQIFGTDLSESAIDRARLGIYSSSIEKDVSPKRLQRFFKKRDGTYQITRIVRDLCTFARQNITTDPPFSRLDLISCRNVLIYLGPQLQRRVLPIFHYALNSNGYLILGPSETVGVFGDMFELVDRRAKIYAKKVLRTPREIEYRSYTGFSEIKSLETPRLAPIAEGADFNSQVMKMADRIMLGTYAPAAVVVDESMQIRQFRGETTPYLEHVTGPATLNLLHMVRPSLVPDLRLTFQRALKLQKPARKERVMMKRNASLVSVDVEVVPFKIAHTDTNWAMVIFKETAVVQEPKRTGARKGRGKSNDKRESVIEHLRQELGATRESLQAIIEEQEATNEELKSANEEIESSNEELQSTNEELETAKEELQSTNEELTTLNEELSNRNLQILQINSDLINVLSSVHIPIVMVDNSLIVRRATPTARDAFNITEADTGRRMVEIRPNIVIPNLEKLLREVIETLHLREREVQDKQGNRYLLQVRPYRTADNKIDGAVLMLVDRQERGRSHVEQGSRKAGKKR